MAEPMLVAKRERVSSFAGTGCAVQALGVLAPVLLYWWFGFPGAGAGLAIMLILFIKGSSLAMTWRCGNCKNPIASKAVRVCPVCSAKLK